ncbi:hypothetical protein BDZ97DRAFT_2055401 [Flammula alnicola]|nr:hypothetical protein BDZ97DRAFT_2055401 [Flammula alnicola]
MAITIILRDSANNHHYGILDAVQEVAQRRKREYTCASTSRDPFRTPLAPRQPSQDNFTTPVTPGSASFFFIDGNTPVPKRRRPVKELAPGEHERLIQRRQEKEWQQADRTREQAISMAYKILLSL